MNDMASRMENKGNQYHHKKLWWIVGIILVMALVAGGLAYAYSGSEEDSSASSSSSAKKVTKPTIKSDQKAKSSSESSSSSSSVSADDLVGLGFQITPVLYNGEDVNTAMNENKAPQNTISEGVQIGYFRSNSQARLTGLPMYYYVHSVNYSVVDGVLEMDTWNIPLKVYDGVLQTVLVQSLLRESASCIMN